MSSMKLPEAKEGAKVLPESLVRLITAGKNRKLTKEEADAYRALKAKERVLLKSVGAEAKKKRDPVMSKVVDIYNAFTGTFIHKRKGLNRKELALYISKSLKAIGNVLMKTNHSTPEKEIEASLKKFNIDISEIRPGTDFGLNLWGGLAITLSPYDDADRFYFDDFKENVLDKIDKVDADFFRLIYERYDRHIGYDMARKLYSAGSIEILEDALREHVLSQEDTSDEDYELDYESYYHAEQLTVRTQSYTPSAMKYLHDAEKWEQIAKLCKAD